MLTQGTHTRGLRRAVHRAVLIVVLTALVGAGALLAPATAAPTGPALEAVSVAPRAQQAVKLTVKPRQVTSGATVRVKGTVGNGPRKVRVLVKYGAGGWKKAATARTKRSGKFNLRVTLSSPSAGTQQAQVRVKAPKAKVRGKKRPAVTTPTRTVTITTHGTSAENEVVRIANRHRAAAGCGPLTMEPRLLAAARGHSADMSAQDYFSHTSLDGRTMQDRIEAAGYTGWTRIGENIAYGQTSAAQVMREWMDSPGHRDNILECGFTEIGVGLVVRSGDGRHYWTQNFGAR